MGVSKSEGPSIRTQILGSFREAAQRRELLAVAAKASWGGSVLGAGRKSSGG